MMFKLYNHGIALITAYSFNVIKMGNLSKPNAKLNKLIIRSLDNGLIIWYSVRSGPIRVQALDGSSATRVCSFNGGLGSSI